MGTFADAARLMFCESRHDVDRQLIGFGQITRHELDLTFHQAADEVNVSGESVQLCNQQHGSRLLAKLKRLTKLRAAIKCIGTLASLN